MYTFSLLLASLLYSASSTTVYHVVPDNQFSSSNNNTYTLDHYLNNVNKYFTSDTELHFLPGHYNLNTIIFVTSVTNFSIIGEIVNGIISVNILCTSFPSGVVITKSSTLRIIGINLMECSIGLNAYSNYSQIVRSDLQLQKTYYGLLIIDVMGKSILSEVSICSLFIACLAEQPHGHVSTEIKVVIVLQKITWLETKQKNSYKIAIVLHHSLITNVTIRDIYFRNVAAIYVQDNTCMKNSIQVISCHFLHITNLTRKLSFKDFGIVCIKVKCACHRRITDYWQYKILLHNCSFAANSIRGHLLYLQFNITTNALIMLDQCTFHNNSISYQLKVTSKRAGNVTFVARDTVFSHLQYLYYVLKAHGLSITFKGKTIFRNIRSKQVLLTTKNSSLTFDGYTELSAIFSRVLISTDQIQLQRGTIMNITQTKFSTALFSNQLEKLVYNVPKEFFSPLYPPCLFQYINGTMLAGQYSILITETNAPRLCTKFFALLIVIWMAQRIFHRISIDRLYIPTTVQRI